MSRRSAAGPTAEDDSTQGGEYQSDLFLQFAEGVEGLGAGAEILDLGATTPDNLLYWAQRGHRVAAIDLLAKDGISAAELGLSGRQFGGIVCWGAICALSRPRAAVCVAELRNLLIPGGRIFAIFEGDGRTVPSAVRYRIAGDGKLKFEPLARDIELRAVTTGEIETLWAGLRQTRVTVMRHGSREAIGQAPGP